MDNTNKKSYENAYLNSPKMTDFMAEALKLAKEAAAESEVPVGAVIVKNKKIIATGKNRCEKNQNALCHAEIEAINNASKALGSWRLDGCELYVTLEPCPMCAGAIINSRISKVVFGSTDRKGGACDSVVNLFSLPFNHSPEVWSGICEQECSSVLSDFFKNIRNENLSEN